MTPFLKRAVLVVVMLLSMFNLFGCSTDQKAEKKILEALEEKYGEAFVLEAIGGGYGTMNDNTLKAVVRPERDRSIRVVVEITKDLKQVSDDYLNVMVGRRSLNQLEPVARKTWSDARLEVSNDTGFVYPDHRDLSMSYEEFLRLYPMNEMLIDVYVNADHYLDASGKMNLDEEYGRYLDFGKQLSSAGFVRSMVTINYLSKDAYNKFDEANRSEVNPTNFFRELEKNELVYVTINGLRIAEDGQITTTREEIFETFDIWNEDRISYFRIKGDSK